MRLQELPHYPHPCMPAQGTVWGRAREVQKGLDKSQGF